MRRLVGSECGSLSRHCLGEQNGSSKLNACEAMRLVDGEGLDLAGAATRMAVSRATVGRILGKGSIVVYESTVFPGCTEEVCVPILEHESGLEFNTDFFCGYSPERINPGDKAHRLVNIKKVTSGSTPEAAEYIDAVYRSIITAGTHLASSIKVAEAAKVIENTQRDVNIALVNELAMIFERMDIDTEEVLIAAGTKWNFLPFRPGLVGGHCIGVDPYYLTHKAQEVSYHPEVILAGRRLNDDMGRYIAEQVVKLMMNNKIQISGSRALVLGLTFKENCPDLRNSRVVDILTELWDYRCDVRVHDPLADPSEAKEEYGIDLCSREDLSDCHAVILAVPHAEYLALGQANASPRRHPQRHRGRATRDCRCAGPKRDGKGRMRGHSVLCRRADGFHHASSPYFLCHRGPCRRRRRIEGAEVG